MRSVTTYVFLATLLAFAFVGFAAAESSVSPLPELRFSGGTFRPLEKRDVSPDWFNKVHVESSASGRRYPVAVTRGPLTAQQRARLTALGAELLDYLPVRGYRLRVPPGQESALRDLPFIDWLGAPPPHYKIEPRLSAAAVSPVSSTRVRVVLHAGEPWARVAERLSGLDPLARSAGQDGAWRVKVTIPPDSIAPLLSSLASLPEVEAIELVRWMRPFNQDAVWVHQSFVGPSPQETPVFDRGIFGCGQIVAVADTGQDYDACYFADILYGAPPVSACAAAPCGVGIPDLNQRKDILYYNWSGTPTGDDDTCPATIGGSGHGTHTSGSVAGDAPAYADCATYSSPGRTGGDGQAPGARLVIQELGDGLEYLNNKGGTIWNLADVAFQSGASIHSISWGGVCHDILGQCVAGCTLPYDSFARDADLAMWVYPDLLMVNAAGNSADFCPPPDSVNTPGIAKNTLTVGSLAHGANADLPSTFSSNGPIFDGRLKPAVAAQGEATVSAASDAVLGSGNCATCSLDGSSMSAPITAGLAALVREYYTAGFYAAGERNASQGITPSGALLKATLIDGAVALGANAPGPDFVSGYGRVLLESTLAFHDSPFSLRVVDHREGVTTGSVVTRAYDVAEGEPFRATLAWSDYPAALNAATARVNELKLEVIDPGGTAWFQTVDAVSGAPRQTSVVSDPHDHLNVEERLIFETPAAGRWIVRVHGVDVPWGPQPFALVVRGALTDCPAPEAPAAPVLSTPADGQVLVSWSAVPGAAAYNVYRGFGACPGGAWVPVASGVTGTSFLDTSVSGGARYRYHVSAASDTGAFCESAPSPCASIVPSGDCALVPQFHGVQSARSGGDDPCAITIDWLPATPYCGTEVRYNVYRGTTPGFAPGPANRIARCLPGTSYTDAVGLSHGADYHYVVRAEDAFAGHGGPCYDGNEETNLVEASAAPDGPPVLGTWSDDAGDTGESKFTTVPPWTLETAGGTTGGPNVYTAASFAFACADLITPILELGSPGTGPQLTFATKHDLEYDPFGFWGAEGSLGQVEVSNGPDFSTWTRVELIPDYPAIVEFPLNNCASTAAIDTYFTGTDMEYSTYTASLVNWGAQEVKIRFHLSGDITYPGGNWWVDDVEITQAMVPGACAPASLGPPPVPDGASVPGAPLLVAKSGGDLLLSWDASRCPATAVNVYRGSIGDYATFMGGDCDLPATGSATLSIPDDSWFVVAATDGAATDGSWSRDWLGSELDYAGSSAACPASTQHVTNNSCP